MKKRFLVIGSILVFGFGVVVGHYKLFPLMQLYALKQWLLEPSQRDALAIGYRDVSDREQVDCKRGMDSSVMVALVFGQSNVANSVPKLTQAELAVHSFFDGRCYQAQDPMLGSDWDQGSIWPRVGDALIRAGRFDRVIFVTIPVGGSSMDQWKPGGLLFPRIENALNDLGKSGLQPTHLLWHQGSLDADLRKSTQSYKEGFTSMLAAIRELDVDAPLYLALATRCRAPVYPPVRQAQLALIAEREDVFPGPDTDAISDMDDRYDFCHFSDSGAVKLIDQWVDVLSEKQPHVPY